MDTIDRRALRDRVRKSLSTAHDSVGTDTVIEFPVSPREANIIVAWNAEYQHNEQAAGRKPTTKVAQNDVT